MDRPYLNFNSRSMPGRWKKAILAATRVVAFSPYITRSAATEAMEVKGPACELHTVVSLEVYASGASKLGCLKRLVAAKVKVYHLETLHAKILLIPKASVTIGSQNMTAGGAGNQESTVIWQDAKAAQHTEQEVEAWKRRRRLVTDAVIRDLEKRLKALQKQHEAWKKAARQSTAEIWTNWEREEARKRREAAEAAAAAARRAQTAERNQIQRYAKEIVRGELKQESGGWSLSNQGQDRDSPPSYCEWIVDGEKKSLFRGRWYPCYHLDTHLWGKARVYKGCISFIDRDLGTCDIRIAGSIYRCAIECRNEEVDPHYNFQLGLSLGSDQAILLGRYEIGKISLEKIMPRWEHHSDFDLDIFRPISEAVNQNVDGAHDMIVKEVMRPWSGNSIAGGYRVDRFFPNIWQTVFTGLRILGNREILVFSNRRQTIQARNAN